jgi:thioredoxin-like negative regulator of GroEL
MSAEPAAPEVSDTTLLVEANPGELDRLLESEQERLLVVYLWGPNCPNCVIFARSLPAMLSALAGAPLRIVKVNVYEHPEVARRYGVYGIPHFLLFKRGRRLGKMSQFQGEEFWLSVVREHLD